MPKLTGTALIVLAVVSGMSTVGPLPIAAPAPREDVVVIKTRLGEIAFRLFPNAAPGHVAYVKDLVGRAFYNQTTFHRVIPHFVIQGGDPNSRDADRRNDGEGEADRRLKGEFSNRLHYRPGTVGMARDADPDSASCQFFIALENIPRLDGKYTIFGEVVSGLEVARAIADLPRDLADNPLEPVEMTVTLESRSVPREVASLKAGPSGEVLTGPDKPRPWDPGDARWSPPASPRPVPDSASVEHLPPRLVEVAVDADGSILDVRFSSPEPEGAAQLQRVMRGWRFTPARFEGRPVKSRFATDSRGGPPGPSRAPGTPIETGGGIVAPVVSVVVPLPPGRPAPEKAPKLRLAVDEAGKVSDASVQESCGDPTLDEWALAAARTLQFTPAKKGEEAVPVYLNIEARFAPAPPS